MEEPKMSQLKATLIIVAFFGTISIIVFLIIFGIMYAMDPEYYSKEHTSSSSIETRTCQVCNRKFDKYSDDGINIGWSNMCELCEKNYHYSQKMKSSNNY